ncbi:MAG TPA: PAS domain S-box protein [Candidatus Acidoferrum sp.]|nr:PAS domain S-box protein [Candidatus Acidoferrum sp.]
MVSVSKKIEETLLESQQRFERLFDSYPEAAAFVDVNDCILEVNPRFVELFGYSQEEAKGKALDDLIVPEDKREEAKALTKESTLGYIHRETVRKSKSGSLIPVLISAAPLTVKEKFEGCVVSYRDITQRKAIEEQLRKSEQRFRGIAERSFDAIAMVDMKGIISYASPSVGKVLGYSQNEVIGKSFLEYFSPIGLSGATQLFADLLQGKSLEGLQLELPKKDGKIATVEINASPIMVDGEVAGIQAVFRDITERKTMEEALRKSEERFRQVAENAQEWIWETDSNGLYTYASPVIENILGYKPEEIVGRKHFYDLFPPEDREEFRKAALDTFTQKKAFHEFINRNLHKNGERVWLSTSGIPVLDKEGNLLGYRGADVDITERRRAEEALRESEEKLRRTLESSPDAIILTDLEGNVIDCNQAALDMYGFSKREEVIGKAGLQFISARDYEKAMESMKTILEKGSARNIEYTLSSKDGKEFLADVSASVIRDASGEPKYLVAITRDITQRKQMEEALKESEEKHRLLFENVNDVVFAYDPEFTVLSVSPSVEKTLGYKPKELVGKKFQELNLLTPASLETAVSNALHVLGGERISPSIYEFVKKDGTKGFGEITSSPLIREGKVIGVIAVARDITERKQMEAKLQHTTKRLQTLLETASEGITTTDPQNNITFVNKAFAEIAGREENELLGLNAATFLDEEGKKKIAEETEVRKKGVTSRYELKIYRKNGEPRVVQLSASPLWKEDGGYAGSLGIVTDITERKQMEQKIRESEERLKQFLEFAPDAIYVNNLNGVFLDGNKQAEIMTGYRKEELIGKNMVEAGLLSEEYASKAIELVQKTMKGQKTGPDEIELIRKDGGRIWVEISSMPVKRGDKTEVLGIARDVSERKKMEDVIHESEEKTRNILQSSPDAIVVTDLSGTMIDCNQAALELAGVSSKEELLGKNTYDLISPKDYEKSMKNMEILLEQGTIRDFELNAVAKNGREFPAEVSMSLMKDTKGIPRYFVATIEDITERKQMQQKLQEYSQQLELLVEKRTKQLQKTQEQLVKSERLAAIGQVAAMVGHDLRNPLTGIKGATYYLKTKPVMKADKKAMEMLGLIEKDIEYSNKIITDLLEYSREIHLELTETTPQSIIEETLSLLKTPNNIQIVNLTEKEPKIKIDIEKLNRVFVNMIKNAFDAMPDGGKLTIKSRRTNGDVEFVFTDTGIGMTEDQMRRIWTPFFTTKAKGLGLGLSICKRIIEAHRGHISFESTCDKGTTFVIALPLEPKPLKGGEETWVNVPESSLLMMTKASEKS